MFSLFIFQFAFKATIARYTTTTRSSFERGATYFDFQMYKRGRVDIGFCKGYQKRGSLWLNDAVGLYMLHTTTWL